MGPGWEKKLRVSQDGEEDLISRLPDDLIHKIISFLGTKEAIQTSVLSKRWKLIWTTLPFLSFHEYQRSSPPLSKLIRHVISKRDNQSQVLEMALGISKGLPGRLGAKIIEYAMGHNVEYLNLDLNYKHRPYNLSIFSSASLKELTLRVTLDKFNGWSLPDLTTLHLIGKLAVRNRISFFKLPDSCFTCLPALRTLCLDDWNFSISSFSFSLPQLTTLRLSGCAGFHKGAWNFPSLLTLELDDINHWYDLGDILSRLVNLQNLTLYLSSSSFKRNHTISSPQLLNLNIRKGGLGTCDGTRIVVLAPKLCNFTAFGIFSIKFEVAELETVNLKLKDWFQYLGESYRKYSYVEYSEMLSGLGDANNLSLDLDSIEALSVISNIFPNMPSPFYKLKYLKLPHGYDESSMPVTLRNYLFGGSCGVSIVGTFPQLQEHLAALAKGLNDSQQPTSTSELLNCGHECVKSILWKMPK